MAHFAKLDENNTVVQVIVVHNNELLDENGVEQESLGIAFCQNLFGPDTIWIQTSYNNNFRVRYAGEGYTYDSTLDAFIPIKPYDSWVLDNSTLNWIEPLEYPTLTQEQFDAGSYYFWDEDAHQSDNTTGWTLDVIPPPFPSWVRTDSNPRRVIWDPPFERPTLTQEQFDGGSYYVWDEDAYQADNTTGWTINVIPSPFPSWIRVNITTGAFWTAPLIKPFLTPEQIDSGSFYVWDEDAYQADNTTGWVLTSQ